MTKEIEVIEGNKLIAEFMDLYDGDGRYPFAQPNSDKRLIFMDGRYHSSWDWLMPVWAKFRVMEFQHNPNDRWGLKEQFENHFKSISYAIVNYEIKIAFDRMVRAITWYNSQQPTTTVNK